MKHLLISILFFSLFFSSCEKGFDYDCTDCTFFYCEVDGEEWTPNCNTGTIGFGCAAIDTKYYPNDTGTIYIYIKNEDRDEGIRINSTNIFSPNNEYLLYKSSNNNFKSTFNRGLIDCRHYRVDTLSTDKLYISEIDTNNFLIAGTFAFTGYNECGDEVLITNGKFRLNYTY